MKKTALEDKKIIVIKAFIVNVLIFCALMLLFEPTAKNDEMHMSLYLIGAFDGNGGFSIWMTPIFDLFVRFFLRLTEYPYTLLIIEYIFVYISFSLIYAILSCSLRRKELQVLMFVIFTLAGYEFYIRLTFTKTSGVLAIAGYVIWLYAIEHGKIMKYGILGGILIFISIIVRTSVSIMVTMLFGSVFLISIFRGLNEEQWKVTGKFLKKEMQYIICVLSVVVMQIGVSKVDDYIFDYSGWTETRQANVYRAKLYDYGWGEYDEFEKKYAELGISENDYVLWHDYHILSDSNILNKKLMEQIHLLTKTKTGEKSREFTAIRNLLKYLFGEPMFFISIILLLSIITLRVVDRKTIWKIIAIYGMALLAYFYLYNSGRTMHHVDVVIFFSVIILLLYELLAELDVKKIKWRPVVIQLVLSVCIFVNLFYSWIGGNLVGSSSYCRVFNNDVEGQKKDLESFRLMSEDTKHFYAYIYNDFIYEHVFPVERGFFHNIYETNYTVDNIAHINQLKNYGIDGVDTFWGEMLNSEMIYFRFSEDTLNQLSIIEQYMKEHYSENAKAYLVKQINDSWIFCFRDHPFDLSDRRKEICSDDVQVDYDVKVEDDHILIEGYAFINGDDSYSENVFIELTDKECGEKRYYISTKMINKKNNKLDKNMGKYGEFKCEIDGNDVNLEQNDLRIIIQKADCTYIMAEK